MKIYTGTVTFPAADEAWSDGPYDPTFNVKVRMDDPSAPKARDGEIRVFKKVGHPQVAYLRSLGKGDKVTLAFQERGDMQWYDFIIGEETTADIAQESKERRPDSGGPKVYTTEEIWPTYENNRDILFAMLEDVRPRLSEEEAKEAPDVAITLFINTMRGAKLSPPTIPEPLFPTGRRELLLDGWNNDARRLLELIAEHEDMYDDTDMPKIVLKELGFKSTGINTNEDALVAAEAAWEVAGYMVSGMDLSVAITTTKERLGKHEADEIPW